MPISKKYRSIFIHIPKNAGESIEKTLGMYRGNPEETLWGVVDNRIVLQHLSAERLRDNYIDEFTWKEYLKFSVVRNPWSKAVSEYHWYLRFGPAITFSEWVGSLSDRLRINEMINILEVGHNVCQYEFLYDQAGSLLVDKVLRFEDLASDFSLLSEEHNWGYFDAIRPRSPLLLRTFVPFIPRKLRKKSVTSIQRIFLFLATACMKRFLVLICHKVLSVPCWYLARLRRH